MQSEIKTVGFHLDERRDGTLNGVKSWLQHESDKSQTNQLQFSKRHVDHHPYATLSSAGMRQVVLLEQKVPEAEHLREAF